MLNSNEQKNKGEIGLNKKDKKVKFLSESSQLIPAIFTCKISLDDSQEIMDKVKEYSKGVHYDLMAVTEMDAFKDVDFNALANKICTLYVYFYFQKRSSNPYEQMNGIITELNNVYKMISPFIKKEYTQEIELSTVFCVKSISKYASFIDEYARKHGYIATISKPAGYRKLDYNYAYDIKTYRDFMITFTVNANVIKENGFFGTVEEIAVSVIEFNRDLVYLIKG